MCVKYNMKTKIDEISIHFPLYFTHIDTLIRKYYLLKFYLWRIIIINVNHKFGRYLKWLLGILGFCKIKSAQVHIFQWRCLVYIVYAQLNTVIRTVCCHAEHKIPSDSYASMAIPYREFCTVRVTFLFRSGIYVVLTVSILPQLSHIDTKCIGNTMYTSFLILTCYLTHITERYA